MSGFIDSWEATRARIRKQVATAATLRGALMRDAKDSITDAIRIAKVGGPTISRS